jgi:phosphoribosylaminoimidazole synthetase
MRYRDAGVDVARGDAVKEALGRAVRSTWGAQVRPIPQGFAGAIAVPAGGPLLAATMDGVGTKLHLARRAGRIGDAAADLVYHCANDLLCHGARPLALLDYVAQSRLEPELIEAAVAGLARACRDVGAALLGGETAEMPDTYLPEVADLAACMIGTVLPDQVLDGSRVAAGDRLLGLGSHGLHTNGYSLARRVLAASGLRLEDPLPDGDGVRIGDALLASHRWYGPALEPAHAAGRIHALAHVTGGGIAGNLVRVLPERAHARVHARAWQWPPVFRWLVEAGGIPIADAREAFNLGIGMVVVCDALEASGLAAELTAAEETVIALGEVVEGERGVEWVEG